MKKHLVAGALALAVAGTGASLSSAQAPQLPELGFDITPNAVKVEGTPKIGSGFHRITLENKGRGEAALVLVKLKQGVTIEAFGKALGKLKNPDDVQKYGQAVASNFWMGPGEYVTTIQLTAADYVFVDMTKKPAARLSFTASAEGMDGGVPLPAPDAEVKLLDYRFSMPSTLKAGKQTIRTANQGRFMHHALVMPLKKGVNEKRVIKDLKAGKEPRYAVGGPPSALVEMVSPKATNDVEVDLKKGKYLFVCFLQNSSKSRPHSMLGMEKIVTVK